jgi:hypothetical protein
MALGSTQPLTEMSISYISRGNKGGQCVVLKILPPSFADCFEIGEPQLPGTLRACPDLRDCLLTDICVCVCVQIYARMHHTPKCEKYIPT